MTVVWLHDCFTAAKSASEMAPEINQMLQQMERDRKRRGLGGKESLRGGDGDDQTDEPAMKVGGGVRVGVHGASVLAWRRH